MSIGNYKDGQYEGLWKVYDEDGRLQSKVNFKDGEVVN